MSSIQVVVRLRPLNDKEKKHGTLPVVSASTNEKTVTVIKGTGSKQARSTFSFDNVFTAFSTQEEVFEATLKPVIKDVMMGFESTVFAYGQTGTGKTHTMEGNLSNKDEYGVIPRSAEAIFQELKKPEYQSHNIICSYLEIYNEELCDLLMDGKKQAKLQIVEGKNGPVCKGLSEKTVSCAGDVLGLMQKAEHQRKVGETNMNKQSSRSHCIFTIRVDAKRRLPDGSIFECRGKLHMVDLAGSECAKTANLGGSVSLSIVRILCCQNKNFAQLHSLFLPCC
jgi:kinesin family protein 11